MNDTILKIKQLNEKTEALLTRGGKKDSQKSALIKKEIWAIIYNHLLNTQEEFKSLHIQNLKLLSATEIVIKTIETNSNGMTSHATQLEGKMLPNGYLYLDTTNSNFLFSDIQRGCYPKEYVGTINGLCETKIQINETGYRFIGSRIPLEFVGNLDLNGKIIFKITKWDYELSGYNYVTKMMSDPFNKDIDKKRDFLDNKSKMILLMKDFKSKLLT